MIKNISPEEFEQLRTKQAASDDTVEITKEEPVTEKKKVFTTEGVKLKEKSSFFEPNPTKYPLITFNNIVKENLTENGEIFVRRMSGEEDIYLQKILYTDDLHVITDNMTKILEGCIKSDINVKSIPIIEKIPLFIYILSISLEENFNAAPIPNCNTCDEETKVIMKVSDFTLKRMPKDEKDFPKKLKLTTYKDSDIYMKVTLPRIGAEHLFVELSKDKKDYIEKLLQIIDDIYGTKNDGSAVKKEEWSSIINYLNIEDKEAIKKSQDDWDEQYGMNTKVIVKDCSNTNCCMIKSGEEVEFNLFDLMRKFLVNMVKAEQITINKPLNENI